jgi:hypothetical protein
LLVKVRLIAAATVLSLIAFAGSVVADSARADGDGDAREIVLIFNGPAVQNTHAAPDTPTFDSWCSSAGPCAPSVMQPVYDASSGALRGTIYVWTKNFVNAPDGKSLCFGEFIWFALAEGDLYTHSGSDGTCGAFIDPSLKAPTHITGVGQVIAGGGDGTIVGGTRRFSKWTNGTYTDRVFVEFDFSGGANYYDQLFFSISKD